MSQNDSSAVSTSKAFSLQLGDFRITEIGKYILTRILTIKYHLIKLCKIIISTSVTTIFRQIILSVMGSGSLQDGTGKNFEIHYFEKYTTYSYISHVVVKIWDLRPFDLIGIFWIDGSGTATGWNWRRWCRDKTGDSGVRRQFFSNFESSTMHTSFDGVFSWLAVCNVANKSWRDQINWISLCHIGLKLAIFPKLAIFIGRPLVRPSLSDHSLVYRHRNNHSKFGSQDLPLFVFGIMQQGQVRLVMLEQNRGVHDRLTMQERVDMWNVDYPAWSE